MPGHGQIFFGDVADTDLVALTLAGKFNPNWSYMMESVVSD